MFLGDTVKEMALPFLLRRVELRNYRSIEHCDVELGPLMFLVGPNGSGKSNFLDALRFVSDCLNTSVDQAVRSRGGLKQISYDSGPGFSIKLTLALAGEHVAEYLIEIWAGEKGAIEITRETFTSPTIQYNRSRSQLVEISSSSITTKLLEQAFGFPPPQPDRLYLHNLTSNAMCNLAHRALTSMAFYHPSVAKMREHQDVDAGDRLARDASNLASVLRSMKQSQPNSMKFVLSFLTAAIPKLADVQALDVADKVTLHFMESRSGNGRMSRFYASNMSDGTLRALGILVALFQGFDSELRIDLVGIEEPETGLHPASAEVLYESLQVASRLRQVLVTSHSTELLERDDVDPNSILAFSAEGDSTLVEPLDDTVRSILRQKLSTPGELLRKDLIGPQRSVVR